MSASRRGTIETPAGNGAQAPAVRFVKSGEGAYTLGGALIFDSVPAAWARVVGLLDGQRALDLDLREVTRTDSAGLALLVECMRRANAVGTTVRFHNIPAQLLAIAKASRLDALLPVD